MKPFSITIQAITKFEEEIRKAEEKYTVERDFITANYKNPEERLQALKETYTEEKEDAKSRCLDAIQLDFNTQRKALHEITTEAMPADFMVTLEALRANGKNIGEYEGTAYIEKYKGNFLALRTLVEMLQGFGKAKGVYVRYPNGIANNMQEVEKMLHKLINTAQVDSMSYALYMSETGPLHTLSNDAEIFLQKNFIVEGEEAAMAAGLSN